MRFYTGQHQHYCGVDLDARSMYVSILDREGNTVLHRNLPAGPDVFLRAVRPFSDDFFPAPTERAPCLLQAGR